MKATRLTTGNKNVLLKVLTNPAPIMLDLKDHYRNVERGFEEPPSDELKLNCYYSKFFESLCKNGFKSSSDVVEVLFFKHERFLQLIYVMFYELMPRDRIEGYDSLDFSSTTYTYDSNSNRIKVSVKDVMKSYFMRSKDRDVVKVFKLISKLSKLRNSIMHGSICYASYRLFLMVEFLTTFCELYKYPEFFKKNLSSSYTPAPSNKFTYV